MYPPWKRTKLVGWVDSWDEEFVWGRVIKPEERKEKYPREYEFTIYRSDWPDDEPLQEGSFLSLHYRGNKFLYVHKIRYPAMSRHQWKKAMKRAHEMWLFMVPEEERKKQTPSKPKWRN